MRIDHKTYEFAANKQYIHLLYLFFFRLSFDIWSATKSFFSVLLSSESVLCGLLSMNCRLLFNSEMSSFISLKVGNFNHLFIDCCRLKLVTVKTAPSGFSLLAGMFKVGNCSIFRGVSAKRLRCTHRSRTVNNCLSVARTGYHAECQGYIRNPQLWSKFSYSIPCALRFSVLINQ